MKMSGWLSSIVCSALVPHFWWPTMKKSGTLPASACAGSGPLGAGAASSASCLGIDCPPGSSMGANHSGAHAPR